MNENTVVDLKQFMVAVITQQTSDIRMDIAHLDEKVTRLDERVATIDERVSSLEVKVDDGFSAIAVMFEDMHTWNDSLEKRLKVQSPNV